MKVAVPFARMESCGCLPSKERNHRYEVSHEVRPEGHWGCAVSSFAADARGSARRAGCFCRPVRRGRQASAGGDDGSRSGGAVRAARRAGCTSPRGAWWLDAQPGGAGWATHRDSATAGACTRRRGARTPQLHLGDRDRSVECGDHGGDCRGRVDAPLLPYG